jgi:hypothetical protein
MRRAGSARRTGVSLKDGPKKTINVEIGGTLGGALGVFVFQLLYKTIDDARAHGFPMRLVGLFATGIGIGIGLGVALAERLRGEGWIAPSARRTVAKESML